MNSQKHLYDLPEDSIYLNGAYMSPLLKSTAQIGIDGLRLKMNPMNITLGHFFDRVDELRSSISTLVSAKDKNSIAIIPSVSYGLSTIAQNIDWKSGDEIIVLEEQFPSNIYVWKEYQKKYNLKIKTVPCHSGLDVSALVIDAITNKTKLISISHVHWANGTKLDIARIRAASNVMGSYLIVDGTQSVGALPFSVEDFGVDALVCAGYKWLGGAYTLGFMYLNERFQQGTPIEYSWTNRLHSENFQRLVDYQDQYKPKSQRFNMGESSNFINVPMLNHSIQKLVEWGPDNIQKYCRDIGEKSLNKLSDAGYGVTASDKRAHHLFGIECPEHVSIESVKELLVAHNIFVSYRSKFIRVSPFIYNEESDFEQLVELLMEIAVTKTN